SRSSSWQRGIDYPRSTQIVSSSPATARSPTGLTQLISIGAPPAMPIASYFIRGIAPVASSVKTYNVMIVNLAFPAKTVPEFIAYAKANPGKIDMGSAGPGSSPHLYGEFFKAMTGVDMVTVHSRGDGPAIPELLAGRIQVMFGSVVTWAEQIKAGTVRALAVTSATRTQLFPDLPPI